MTDYDYNMLDQLVSTSGPDGTIMYTLGYPLVRLPAQQ
jgi:hypothetical protein